MKKICELGQKNILIFFIYELILVFPKFDPLTAPWMALSVDLGPKCKILFPLV